MPVASVARTARCDQRMPATNSTAAIAAVYTSAVPMSGWTNTSRIGSRPSPIAASGVRADWIECRRSARNPASTSTNSTFPNSDGWNLKKPTSIQRFEPRVAAPAASTSTMIPSVPK